MKNILIQFTFLIVFLFAGTASFAQQNFFADTKELSAKNENAEPANFPVKYRSVILDTAGLLSFFKKVPSEKNTNPNNAPIISIPLPNGTTSNFHVWGTSIMEPALAAKYPTLKTYTGQGIEDRTATIKIDWTAQGFHAMILSPVNGAVFIDPFSQSTKTNYISYYKVDYRTDEQFIEEDLEGNQPGLANPQARPLSVTGSSTCVGTQLRTYRLAIACTHQYAIAATGLSAPSYTDALSAIVTTIQRVNGIYETELSVSLILVAKEDTIIFTNASGDPFSTINNNTSALITKGQQVIDKNIGNANYDVGETFSTGAGGASVVGVVCQSGSKANSAVGVTHPVGDPFNVDYVSHEIGHEFGAHHPFNSNTDYCAASGQQYSGTNDEPGSGSTIMAYASSNSLNGLLCGTDNLQPESDPYFNGINFDEIRSYVNDVNGSCAVVTPTNNHAPVVNAGADYTIPAKTPFVLTGSATDADGDALTYSWEQVDVDGQFCAWDAPLYSNEGNAPLFRSFPPVATPTRYFPKLSDVINNTTTIGEIMPTYARTMHFRLTARDNRASGGGVCYDENAITVAASSGPFIVTYPDTANIIWSEGDSQTITWNPAGTQSAPVNCNNVMIQLSTDGGLTFPDTLIASTPNNGSVNIKVPDTLTSTARIRIVAIGNIFYDISNNNFAIQSPIIQFDWISFSVTAQSNNTALLNWTVNESNTDHYEIEHSADSVNFEKIGQLPSITGNGVNQQYSFIDANPLPGKNYYRIKEVNQSSGYTYSLIKSLLFNPVSPGWRIYPVPAKNDITIVNSASVDNVTLQLYDATGRLVYESELGQTSAGQQIIIAMNRFAKGIYTLKIISYNGLKEERILLE